MKPINQLADEIHQKQIKYVNIFYRLIALPFVAALVIIAAIRNAIYTIGLFLLFGGEWNTYKQKNESKIIYDCYELLKAIQSDKSVAIFRFDSIPELIEKLKQ